MEIMGLAIIVILVTLGIFFVIHFTSTRNSTNIEKEYTDSQMSANLLNTMLQMTAPDCNSKQIKSLFRDCALNQKIICNDGKRSCEYLNYTIQKILDKTLVKWNRKFYFEATETDTNYPLDGIIKGRPCDDDVDSDIKQYPIQAERKTVMISLHICDLKSR
jgi:hypothetical protein